MKLLGQDTMTLHADIACTLTREARRLLKAAAAADAVGDLAVNVVQVDDIRLLAQGAIGDLAAVTAAATIGRDLATIEKALLAQRAKEAVWQLITERQDEWVDS